MKSLPEMIATVEIYIHIRTNKEIRINQNKINIVLLINANNIANRYFRDNNITIYKL